MHYSESAQRQIYPPLPARPGLPTPSTSPSSLLPPLARYIPAIAKMSLSGSGAHEKRPRLIFMCTDVINEREEGEEEEEERIEWRTDLAELAARPCFITSTTARAQMRSNPFRFSSLRVGRTLPRVQIFLRWDLFFSVLAGRILHRAYTVDTADLRNEYLSIKAPPGDFFFLFCSGRRERRGIERRKKTLRATGKDL